MLAKSIGSIMKPIFFGSVIGLIFPFSANAMVEGDPVIVSGMIEQFEFREAHSEHEWVWEARAYIGQDLNKFWLTTEGENISGDNQVSEFRALYSHAILPYWDINLGVRHEIRSEVEQTWLQLGIEGVAPYFIDSELVLFLGDKAQSGLRFEFEKELILAKRWSVIPELEMSFHGYNDKTTQTGSGLSVLEAGVRLHYDVIRELSPYIGMQWEKLYGNSAHFNRQRGNATGEAHFLFGIRAWF